MLLKRAEAVEQHSAGLTRSKEPSLPHERGGSGGETEFAEMRRRAEEAESATEVLSQQVCFLDTQATLAGGGSSVDTLARRD